MKALTDVATIDRISTREELKQVLDLLSDVNSTRLATLDLAEVAGPGDLILQEESADEMPGSEYAQVTELGTLASLFLSRHQRTN